VTRTVLGPPGSVILPKRADSRQVAVVPPTSRSWKIVEIGAGGYPASYPGIRRRRVDPQLSICSSGPHGLHVVGASAWSCDCKGDVFRRPTGAGCGNDGRASTRRRAAQSEPPRMFSPSFETGCAHHRTFPPGHHERGAKRTVHRSGSMTWFDAETSRDIARRHTAWPERDVRGRVPRAGAGRPARVGVGGSAGALRAVRARTGGGRRRALAAARHAARLAQPAAHGQRGAAGASGDASATDDGPC
jgi:hypothetical protein